jgi:hypothetical protein
MKNIWRNVVLVVVLFAATAVFAGIPPVNVTVSDAGGKAAFKGATSAGGTFATGKLKPGDYTVRFNSASAPKGGRYALAVSAGKNKMVANGIAAEKLAAGGVAMKIAVGAGLNIAGQVTAEDKNSAPMGSNGKLMVWIPKRLGSNISAHWAESDSAEAKEAMTSGSYSTKNIQDKQAQGITPSQRGDGR